MSESASAPPAAHSQLVVSSSSKRSAAPGGDCCVITSWNVAGWSTTAALLRSLYGGSFVPFLELLRCDVLALQEVKGNTQRLKEDPFASGACDKNEKPIDGWDTFWHFSTDRRSLNGVATFARKGSVLAAIPRIFNDAELDDEGRCLVTIHAQFALFNVYVVNGRHGQRVDFKVRFLNALRNAMAQVRRDTGLPVILAGDMNMIHRVDDGHWVGRGIDHEALKAYPADGPLWAGVSEGERQRMLCTVDAFVSNRDRERDAPVYVESLMTGKWFSQENEVWKRAVAIAGKQQEVGPDVDIFRALLQEDRMVDSTLVAQGGGEGDGLVGRFTCWNQMRNERYENCGRRIDYILVDAALECRISGAAPPSSCPAKPTDDPSGALSLVQRALTRISASSSSQVLAECTLDGKFSGTGYEKDVGLPPLSKALCEMTVKPQQLPRTDIIYTAPQLSDHVAVQLVLAMLPNSGSIPVKLQALLDSANHAGGTDGAPNSVKLTTVPGGRVGGFYSKAMTQACLWRRTTPDISQFFLAKKPSSTLGTSIPVVSSATAAAQKQPRVATGEPLGDEGAVGSKRDRPSDDEVCDAERGNHPQPGATARRPLRPSQAVSAKGGGGSTSLPPSQQEVVVIDDD
jgi:exonuclease III